MDSYSDIIASLPPVFGLPTSGKVRDTFLNSANTSQLLPVFSDRMSTHNVKHITEFPTKGELLHAQCTYIALEVFKDIPNHLVAVGKRIYDHLPKDVEYHPRLQYRAPIVVRQEVTGFEFIHRSNYAGSLERDNRAGWPKYNGVNPYGFELPRDLPLMHPFAEPLFTPTDKSEDDDPRNAELVARLAPFEVMLSRKAYLQLKTFLASRGIRLIDGKFEASRLMLVDEWGTGDCCRMAYEAAVQLGVEPEWLDKELPRQEAIRMWNGGKKVPLRFSDEVVKKTIDRYHQAFETIAQMTLGQFQKVYLN